MVSPSVGAASRMPWSAIDAMLVGHAVGDLRAQAVRDEDHLGVRAVGDHPVAGSEAGHAFTDREHDARVAVALRHQRIELALDRLDGRHQPLRLDPIEHLPDALRLLAGLLQEVRLRELHHDPLGADGQEAGAGPDEQVSASHAGRGDVRQDGLTRLQVLHDLTQEGPSEGLFAGGGRRA